MTRSVTIEAHLALDYPKETETITSPHYTLRLSTSNETQSVEVAVDGGPWQPCRQASGHFWFDWTGYMQGRHEIRARARLSNGETEHAAARRVLVELDHQPR